VGHRASLERSEKFCPTPGFDLRTVQAVASRYADYATRPTVSYIKRVNIALHSYSFILIHPDRFIFDVLLNTNEILLSSSFRLVIAGYLTFVTCLYQCFLSNFTPVSFYMLKCSLVLTQSVGLHTVFCQYNQVLFTP
jgi:hypothetical protein